MGLSGAHVFVHSCWEIPWNPYVQSSDASEYGWGMSGSFWTREKVGSIGRVPERARFKRKAGVAARENAFAQAGFDKLPTSGESDPFENQ